MKFKVKFRVTHSSGQSQKFAINLEAETTFSVKIETFGLGLDSHVTNRSPFFSLTIRGQTLFATDTGFPGGLRFNKKTGRELALRVGDFIDVGQYTVEFLEAPQPEEATPGTQFMDVSEIDREFHKHKIEEPSQKVHAAVEVTRPNIEQEAKPETPSETSEPVDSPIDASPPKFPENPIPQKETDQPTAPKPVFHESTRLTARGNPEPVRTQGSYVPRRPQRFLSGAAAIAVIAAAAVYVNSKMHEHSQNPDRSPASGSEVPAQPPVVNLDQMPAAKVAVAPPPVVPPPPPVTPPPATPPPVTPPPVVVAPQPPAPVSHSVAKQDNEAYDRLASDQFFAAIKAGNLSIVRSLISKKAVDPDFTLDHGSTPLMYAAARGRAPIVEYLLSIKVNPNAKDPSGTTALMWAAYGGHKNVVESLLKYGADTRIRRDDGDRAADIAGRWNHQDIADLLKKASDRQIASKAKPTHPKRRSQN